MALEETLNVHLRCSYSLEEFEVVSRIKLFQAIIRCDLVVNA